jgi:cobalt-zinc-cadmium efflux system outer membrane protein
MARFLIVAKLLAAGGCTLLGGCLSTSPRLIDLSGINRTGPAAPPAALVERVASFAADRAGAPVSPAVATGTLPVPSAKPASSGDLPELLRRAAEISPALKQAAADVAAARGAAVQAGLHPNPTVGYQGDQIGSGHTAGQQGAFLSQTIITRGKLGLAQAAALAEVTRTEAAFQNAQSDLAAQVQARYYALMTTSEALRIAGDMARTADALAERHQKLLDSGQAVAPHEVAQARALAAVARGEVVQAANRRTAAAKQLAVVVGTPDIPAADVVPADRPLPVYSFDRLREHVLAQHPELRAAAAQVERARFQLELARATPYPNVETNTYVQHDYQTHTPQFGVQIGVALPVFDRNEGNIAQAEAHLVRATHETARVRLDLTHRLADAYERYSTNRRLVDHYRAAILPEQVKAFDGLRKRFEQEPGKVSFSEVVLAQQTLARTYADYVGVLSAAWQAVAELSRLVPAGAPTEGPEPSGRMDSWPEPDPGR